MTYCQYITPLTICVVKCDNTDTRRDIVISGDDSSDEPMFEALNALQASEDNSARSSTGKDHNQSIFGVTVGKKPTAAGATLDDPHLIPDNPFSYWTTPL